MPRSARISTHHRTGWAFSSGLHRRVVGNPGVRSVGMTPSSFPRSGASNEPRAVQTEPSKTRRQATRRAAVRAWPSRSSSRLQEKQRWDLQSAEPRPSSRSAGVNSRALKVRMTYSGPFGDTGYSCWASQGCSAPRCSVVAGLLPRHADCETPIRVAWSVAGPQRLCEMNPGEPRPGASAWVSPRRTGSQAENSTARRYTWYAERLLRLRRCPNGWLAFATHPATVNYESAIGSTGPLLNRRQRWPPYTNSIATSGASPSGGKDLRSSWRT